MKFRNKKLELLGYIFAPDSVGLSSVNLAQLASKVSTFGEIIQNDGHFAI